MVQPEGSSTIGKPKQIEWRPKILLVTETIVYQGKVLAVISEDMQFTPHHLDSGRVYHCERIPGSAYWWEREKSTPGTPLGILRELSLTERAQNLDGY